MVAAFVAAPMNFLKRTLRAVFAQIERLSDTAFGAENNPLTQLGALGWMLFWIVAGSGIYLYIFLDTGVTEAYQSLQSITYSQWFAGGVMRSLHRYASDALVVLAFLHLLREFSLDRLRGVRWFAWITGIVVLVFVYVCGITGYWLVWDRLSEYVARVTSAWLDALPIFAEPIAQNFASNDVINGRFFTLMVYIHIAAPLLMLGFMWLHIQRYNYAAINPRRRLMTVVCIALLVLSLIHPAISQPPADLDHSATMVNLDWFYLTLYPLVDIYGGKLLWTALTVGLLLFIALPWSPRLKRPAPALVHLDNCNGCARCFDDCPFGAITMQPRTDGSAFQLQASVNVDQCTSCGLCVGACPTATPFRRATELVPGIELPDQTLQELREQLITASKRVSGDARIVAFRCATSAKIAETKDVVAIPLPCLGALPPSFIDFALSKQMFAGVLLAGCAGCDCYFRLGARWTEARIAQSRDPYLRKRTPRECLTLSFSVTHDVAIRNFQEHLRSLPPIARSNSLWRESRPRHWFYRYAVQALIFGTLIAFTGFFATQPAVALLDSKQSIVTLSFTHASEKRFECKQLSPAELAKLEPNMRRPTTCARERWPLAIELRIDDRIVYAGERPPTGLWDDGPASVFERVKIPSGLHRMRVRMGDNGRADFNHIGTAEITLEPGRNLVIEYDASKGFTFH
ncbi:MAG TPA: cytochrome b N-terminal domain-containing protein [Steroidobacteraceae bacterium]|nr:cytochrome b N-terminal domain-containing protein [Steroidobacteraceae bacterium]